MILTPRSSHQIGLIDNTLGSVVDVPERRLFSLLPYVLLFLLGPIAPLSNLDLVHLSKTLLALNVLPLLFVRSLPPHFCKKL